MDIEKEREAFQECYKTSRDYKFYVRHEMSEKQIFEFKGGKYVVNCVNHGWGMWQAAKAQAEKALLEQFEINNKLVGQIEKLKAQAIPGGFVLVPVDTLEESLEWAHIAKWDSTSDAEDERIAHHEAIIESAISAQEQSHD